MQKKKLFSFTTLILNLMGFLIIFTTAAAAYPVSVQDSKGNLLEFFQTPVKVVSLVPSATQILFEIGANDFVKAITYHDITLAGAAGKQIIGGFLQPSIDKIKAVGPDMIILSPLHKDIIKRFKKTGCKIFIFNTDSIENSYKSMMALGKIFDRKKEAQKIIEKNKSEINHIKQKLGRIDHLKNKRVIRLMGRDTIMTPGSDSFQNEIIRAAGGIPPDFGRKGNIISVTKKEWMKFNPQVIYGCGPDKEAAENFFSKPGWKNVDAIKNKQIYYFPCDLTCRASTHTGYFASWLSSVIYSEHFSKSENNILPAGLIHSKPVKIDLEYIKSASIAYSNIYDFKNKTLIIDFKSPQSIVSTLEGERDNITSIGNHFTPPPTWAPSHKRGIEHIKSSILNAMQRQKQTTSFLITGADMDNLSIQTQSYKDIKVFALVTAGVMSNAVRMSKDTGAFYEPGTINIILLTNMQLSKRAMTRAIISGTEGKTAALEDMDIRSSYTPLVNEATGTGTDNILVVQGTGVRLENAGGHTKLGELIAKAVYEGVQEAVDNQNGLYTERNIFMRLAERKISVYDLLGATKAYGSVTTRELSESLVEVLLNQRYAGFLAASLAISDAYEKGLIADLTSFTNWGMQVAGELAGFDVQELDDMKLSKDIPHVQRMALNALLYGIYLNSYDTIKEKS
ncbi:MAG: adenosylcobinamide amidohydrolase [Desulfobacula sp.]|nr:adenosylcobinamide amidohydrolase [Desulfobacula sp.]